MHNRAEQPRPRSAPTAAPTQPGGWKVETGGRRAGYRLKAGFGLCVLRREQSKTLKINSDSEVAATGGRSRLRLPAGPVVTAERLLRRFPIQTCVLLRPGRAELLPMLPI